MRSRRGARYNIVTRAGAAAALALAYLLTVSGYERGVHHDAATRRERCVVVGGGSGGGA